MNQENKAVQTSFDAATGVATLTLAMAGRANKINADFGEGLVAALDWAEAQDGLQGIIIGTAHRDFCVGADLDKLFAETDADTAHVLRSLCGRAVRDCDRLLGDYSVVSRNWITLILI